MEGSSSPSGASVALANVAQDGVSAPGAVPDPLFPVSHDSVERLVRSVAREAELPGWVTPHVLRHSYATALLNAGWDIRRIQIQLGHTDFAMTAIYLNVGTGPENADLGERTVGLYEERAPDGGEPWERDDEEEAVR